MKILLAIIGFMSISMIGFGQSNHISEKNSSRNKLYIYWGWNWSSYTKSSIRFQGDNYDFTLANVLATDRPSKFSLDTYFNPTKFTIPQYNVRVGYSFREKWDISLGIDHMKYVVQQNQLVNISGNIENTNSIYDGTYSDENILIVPDFLTFEHSDGLNYVNVELRHSNKIFHLNPFTMSLIKGGGIGVLVPKTNVTLLGYDRYNKFHVSGYGMSLTAGLRLTFHNKFFVQSEMKGGFIDLPDVRTTMSKADRANHHFFFSQLNIVFGGMINLRPKKRKQNP
ncbi:MAG: hypothetical protein AAF587_43410 [Bacteroidota bacterium]